MRRTTVACLVFAATFGLSGTANITSAAASPVALPGKQISAAKETRHAAPAVKNRQDAAGRTSLPRRAGAGMKTVRFGGYAFDVPAGWPVYRLGRDSNRCVRYDTNAVYLGAPGTNQQCPAHLVGQAGTVSVAAPGAISGAGSPAAVLQSAEVGGTAGRRQPGVSVSATYGSDPRVVQQVLHSLRDVLTGKPVTLRQSALAPAPVPVAPSQARRSAAVRRSDVRRSAAERRSDVRRPAGEGRPAAVRRSAAERRSDVRHPAAERRPAGERRLPGADRPAAARQLSRAGQVSRAGRSDGSVSRSVVSHSVVSASVVPPSPVPPSVVSPVPPSVVSPSQAGPSAATSATVRPQPASSGVPLAAPAPAPSATPSAAPSGVPPAPAPAGTRSRRPRQA